MFCVLKWGVLNKNIFLLKEDSMKKERVTWSVFLSVLAAAILALVLVGCNSASEPPKGEHPTQGEAQSEHPETPKPDEGKSEHPEHPKAESEE